MLSSRQQTLTIDQLLKYERIEDLVHDVIEQRVNTLAFEGFSALQSWCVGRGLEIQVPQGRMEYIVEFIATRNVFAHNRGIVDERYIRAVPGSRYRLGDVRGLDVEDLITAISELHQIVAGTDRAVAEKFQLQTGPIDAYSGLSDGPSSHSKN